MPRRFENRASFAALWKILDGMQKKALNYCKSWAEHPHKLPGPLLMGKTGTFKTHLVHATAAAISDNYERAVRSRADQLIADIDAAIEDGKITLSHEWDERTHDWPLGMGRMTVTDGAEIAHHIRRSVELRNLDQVIADYRMEEWAEDGRAVLIVDDVEVMKLSDWLHEELYRIFDFRYQEQMPTMVATNLSSEELRKHLGDRIARRIIDMTEPFQL
jgi:DNA replication protein DnaC